MRDSKKDICDDLIIKSGLEPESGKFPFIDAELFVLMKEKKNILRNKRDRENIFLLRHVLMFNGLNYHVKTDDCYTKFYLD